MKTLLLMRHAKSSWDDKDEPDRDRSLSKRGKRDAARMGNLLKDEKLIPDLILASNATRTRQTADLIIEAMKYAGDRCYLNNLYMAEMDMYLQEIKRFSDGYETVLLIGHSPTLDSLLQMLSKKVVSLPTGAIAHITLPIDSWNDFQVEILAELVHLWRPKDL